MPRFSANLGFLWTDRTLPDAIRAAAAAGFDAVEFHWPYDEDRATIRSALDETGLPVLALNARRGDPAAGEFGLAAIPGREAEARTATHEALDWAEALGAPFVHVLAGRAEGPRARATYLAHLDLAAAEAARRGLGILVEPLNRHDAPGYFLGSTADAAAIIAEVGAPNLRLMFDCYHVGRTERDVSATLRRVLPFVGHIQVAAVPDRGPPDHGEVDYPALFAEIDGLGWTRPLGAEYKPHGPVEDRLAWMR